MILLFQPAEEIGTGAIAVCSDPRFEALKPDWAFALHNLPDIPRGQAHVPQGLVSAPSVGLLLQLSGLEAHASTPEAGRSPAPAVAQLMDALPALSHGTFPAPDFKLVTLCHAALGTPAFGIAPGQAEMRVTCRTTSDADLEGLVQDVQALAQDAASRQGLDLKVTHQDPFLAGINDPKAAAILTEAAQDVGLSVSSGTPLRASEDFGRFGHGARAAMLLLGAGPGPMLHHPEYDFDDGLIAPGATLLANGARLALAAQKS
ncbi:hypothetical protein JANAI62_28580 [Jannaschia pagri]|uniref:Peptidase M20 dimerisation domain-containing protein n=1 Tax=Jannaschia pagri TaxID=2829797 RepID=A0ABQ4NPB0_9RHOB|nr:hypothetical protein JANAI62_28580 [Jannaschia sp. AI_62]